MGRARSLQPGKHPRPLTRKEVPAIPPSLGAYFHASLRRRNFSGNMHPNTARKIHLLGGPVPRQERFGASNGGSHPPFRREIVLRRRLLAACRTSDGASWPNADRVTGRLGLGQEALPKGNGSCGARSLQPGKHPRPLTRKEVPATPPSLGAYFHASLQPGKLPRPLTRREVRACPRRRRRASMQAGVAKPCRDRLRREGEGVSPSLRRPAGHHWGNGGLGGQSPRGR